MTTINTNALSEFDFIVVLDASGSMGTEDCPGGKSRWAYMQESVTAFARDIEKFDADGIDVVVFSGSGIDSYTGVTANKVADIFASRSPRSSTPLAEALEAALALAGKNDKRDFVLVFTDGTPDNETAVASLITEVSNGLDSDEELTFLFVQVGKDSAATSYLQRLDDGLTGAKFDIVDAKTITEAEKFATTAELVLAAIAD